MSHIGKESRIIELIQAKTKMSKDDIYDVLWVLPEVFAEFLMEKSPEEKCSIHMGVVNVYWQTAAAKSPEVVFLPTDRFKRTLSTLKYKRETALAKQLYDNLPHNLKTKLNNSQSKKIGDIGL